MFIKSFNKFSTLSEFTKIKNKNVKNNVKKTPIIFFLNLTKITAIKIK